MNLLSSRRTSWPASSTNRRNSSQQRWMLAILSRSSASASTCLKQRMALRAFTCAGTRSGCSRKRSAEYVESELKDWELLGVEGHFRGSHPWLGYHRFLSEQTARLVGAKPAEVVVMNSLTVNLHLMMVSFYRPTAQSIQDCDRRERLPFRPICGEIADCSSTASIRRTCCSNCSRARRAVCAKKTFSRLSNARDHRSPSSCWAV